jgi:L-threonylcarbamoyladenylate synthase
MLRLRVNPQHPESEVLIALASVVRSGGVVAIPTDTLYGLAVDPFNADAVRRLFQIKHRDATRAIPLIAANAAQVRLMLGALPEDARRLAARFWPGPLTLVVPAPPTLAPGVADARGTVGVRVPDHAAIRALAAACGVPLTSTSANISGDAATADPDEVVRQLGAALDGMLDAGRTPGGLPSTIVDVTVTPPTLLRPGAVPWEEIHACLLE